MAARWKLTAKHYINVDDEDAIWEYKETIQAGPKMGRSKRVVHKVPVFYDPDDPSCHNYQGQGIIVTNARDEQFPWDIILQGPPSPDMEPLNEEARKITAAEQKKWVHPIESLQNNGEDLLLKLTRQLEAMFSSKGIPQGAVSVAGVSAEQFGALQEQVKLLVEQNAALQAQLSGLHQPEAEPLEDLDIDDAPAPPKAAAQPAGRRV